jgi:hypothetical protein
MCHCIRCHRIPTTKYHCRPAAWAIFLISFITFSLKEIKKIAQAAGSTVVGFNQRAAFGREDSSTIFRRVNEVSGPADGAAAMTGPHHICLYSIYGGLAWLLPAGPRM